jgi:hypothetical protein
LTLSEALARLQGWIKEWDWIVTFVQRAQTEIPDLLVLFFLFLCNNFDLLNLEMYV